MFLLLSILTGVLVVVTLLPLSRAKVWWVRGWDFPRAQIGFLAVAIASAQLWLGLDGPGAVTIVVVAAAIACYQWWWIWPFTPLHRCDVKAHAPPAAATGVRVLAVNVLQTNRRAARLRALIRAHRPDIVLAVETDPWWVHQLRSHLTEFPHVMACPLENFYGMLLLSRWPLHDGKVQFLVEPDAPSIHVCVQTPDGTVIRLACLHPAPPSPTENDESTERDAELLLLARSLAHERRPTIVMGDLNDVAWSRTTRLFRRISRLLDPRVGRGRYNTFHARWPFARWPVDHLFHSRQFTLVRIERLPAFGSDHFPVFAELALNGGKGENEPALRAKADDERHAREESMAAGKHEPVHVPQSPP